MKIVFFEIEDWQRKFFKKSFPNDKLAFTKDRLTAKNAQKYADYDLVSTFIYSKVDEEVLNTLTKLKFIATRSTGFDHINLESCRQKGIRIANVPTYGENTVAELSFALLLGLSRKLISSVERTRRKNFHTDGLKGFDLKGKTLGVIGTGNIGKYSLRMGRGFGMNLLAFDIIKDKKFAKEIDFKYVSLEKLFGDSDVITMHVPYNKHTHHLAGKKMISLMKKDSVLINTSRGGVVDTLALLKALKSKKLAGAGLDVLEEELGLMEEFKGRKGEHWKKADKKIIRANLQLLKMENVLVSPHNGFNTQEAIMRILDTTTKNINSFKSKKSVNLV